MPEDASRATRLLERASRGDGAAGDELLPLVYEELHGLARSFMGRQRSDHTLQATALVHEAYLRLIDKEYTAVFENKLHFYRVAARAMRSVLMNHARDRGRLKRGGDRERVELYESAQLLDERSVDLLALDEALDRLAGMDDSLARIVELRFFAGLTIEETAKLLGVSTPTVERGWRIARSVLRRDLRGGDEP